MGGEGNSCGSKKKLVDSQGKKMRRDDPTLMYYLQEERGISVETPTNSRSTRIKSLRWSGTQTCGSRFC